MEAEETIVTWLSTYAPLTALIADRLYPGVIPREKPRPSVAYARVGTEPLLTVHGTKPAEFASIEIQAWATTATDANQVGDAIEAALAAHGEIPTNRRVDYDGESGNFGDVIEVRLLINF